MANVIEIILKGTDAASKEISKVQKSTEALTDVLTGMSRAAVGIAGVGAAMKKAFDLGREGAAIEQTAESFEFLMDKVGAAPDLLDQLRAASNDTISSFELQSSTMTLLAGAQGELATALADSTPRLLEIAKAANKLNPALGTTSFMYESIATGVKRAQPLILDNLGLTLKVGEANEAYAQSIGKTVEEMTSQDRAMAILNATLEAGDALIDQVGGTTDSATDTFDQLDVAMGELSDTIKRELAPFLNKAAKALLDLMTQAEKTRKVLIDHEEEVGKTAETYEDYRREMVRVAEDTHMPILTLQEYNRAMEEGGLSAHIAEKAIIVMGEAQFHASRITEEARDNHFLLIDAYNAEQQVVDELTPMLDRMAEANQRIAENSNSAAKESKEFLDGIDRDIQSPIDNFIKDLEWFILSGGRFEKVFAKIQTLAKEYPEEARGYARELLGYLVDTREEAGLISMDEALEDMEDFGFKAGEARDIIGGTDSLEHALTRVDALDLRWESLLRGKTIADEWLEAMRTLQNTDWSISATVGFLTTGQPPGSDFPSGGGGGGGGGTTTTPYEPGSSPRGGERAYSIVQNFNVDSMLDIEEIASRLAES